MHWLKIAFAIVETVLFVGCLQLGAPLAGIVFGLLALADYKRAMSIAHSMDEHDQTGSKG